MIEEEEQTIPQENKKIILKENTIEKDPTFLYYIDKEGNTCKIKKTGPKKNVEKAKIYSKLDISVPKILLNAFCSDDIKTIRKIGDGGYLHLPKRFVGKRFKVILIPENEIEEYKWFG